MTSAEAKDIGAKYGIYLALLGLFIAQAILIIFLGFKNGFFWITQFEFLLNILVGILVFILAGYFLGQFAATQILIKRAHAEKTGALLGLSILLISSLAGSLLGFFNNKQLTMNSIEDYIFKPIFWIVAIGFLPAIVFGIFFGKCIKRRGNRNSQKL